MMEKTRTGFARMGLAVMAIAALLACVFALAWTAPAFADETPAGGAATAAAAADEATAEAKAADLAADESASAKAPANAAAKAPAKAKKKTVAKSSKYGLLAKNGYVYPCNAKGKKLANYWTSGGSGAYNITKLFIAANVKSIPAKVTEPVHYSTIGNKKYKWSVSGLHAKTVTFMLKGGKSSVAKVSKNAFNYSSYLKKLVNFEKTKVTAIGESSFANTKLTTIKLPKTLKSIGKYAFEYSSLKTVSGLDKTKVASIGKYVFGNCVALTSIALPNTCKSVGQNAFYKCAKLKTVKLGAKTATINDSAFDSCTALASVDFGGVKSIGYWAFNNCTKLSSITLPASLTQLKSDAFNDCTGLKTVKMLSPKVVVGEQASSSMSWVFKNSAIDKGASGAYIYVPASLLSAYSKDDYENPWREYASKFRSL